MAATVVRSRIKAVLLLVALLVPSAFPDQPSDIRAVLQHIATGLGDGNPADAIKQFDPSFREYDKLRDYFDGLTGSYQLVNEVNLVDEQDTSYQTEVTVDWTITLGDLTNPGVQDTRRRRIQIRLICKKHHWRVVEFSPIDLFDPQFHPRSSNMSR